MKLPIGLMLASLLLWGYQSHLIWLGAAIGLLLEIVQYIRQNPRQSTAPNFVALNPNLPRYSIITTRLCLLNIAALVIYLFNTKVHFTSSMPLVQWLPFTLLPLVLLILYSGERKTDLGLFMQALGERKPANGKPHTHANLGYPWLALCLLSSSMAKPTGDGLLFYLLFCVCAAYALWHIRPRAQAFGRWSAAFCLALALGALIHFSLAKLQTVVEEWAMTWLMMRPPDDAINSQTSMGHIGALKLGDEIRLQVTPMQANGQALSLVEPLLLMQASYNIYQDTSWKLTGNNSFVDLHQSTVDTSASASTSNGNSRNSTRWNLTGNHQEANAQLDITSYSPFNHMLLALPLGSRRIEVDNNNLTRISRNPLGSTQGFMEAGYFQFRVAYQNAARTNSNLESEGLPSIKDLQIPERERAMLIALAQQLQLPGKTAQQAMPIVQHYFASNFRYSTWRNGIAPGKSALADFLMRERSGHCEHFATASALLLRAAGIPTRYAVGYSVQEPSHFGSAYIARQRDAHAWTRVFVDGRWQDFDTTPAGWLSFESKSRWEWLQDGWFWLRDKIRNWEWQRSHLSALAVALCLALFVPRWLRRRQQKSPQAIQREQAKALASVSEVQGVMAKVLQRCAELDLARNRSESLLQWQQRIAPQLRPDAAEELHALIELYYAARFSQPKSAISPMQSLPPFETSAQAWLTRWPAQTLLLPQTTPEPEHA